MTTNLRDVIQTRVTGFTGSTGATGNPFTGGTFTGGVTLKGVGETIVALGSTSSPTLDASAGTVFTMTLTGNVTISSLTNAVTGTNATLVITQDGTGSRTLTSTMKFAGGNKTLSTAAGAIDIISIFYDGSTYLAALTKGYA